MANYINLTTKEKNELRRLTQKANRQIKQFDKMMRKEGLQISPNQPTGGIQHRSQWETEKNPLSRSTKFSDKSEFKQRMRWLRTFDSEVVRPKYTEYSLVERDKLKQAIETSLGTDLDEGTNNNIDNMGLGKLKKFWDKFSNISARLGLQYSSGQAMAQTVEFFKEDLQGVIENSQRGV